MPDSSYLHWPFLDARHRELKTELDQWCEANSELLDPQVTDRESDLEQRAAGWMQRAAGWYGCSVQVVGCGCIR